MDEIEVGADLHGYTEVLGLWAPRQMCNFEVCIVGTYAASIDGRH